MSEKFTPGPWEVIGAEFTEHGACYEIVMPENVISKANACLIAAAPEMYELLTNIEWCDSGEYHLPYCPCCGNYDDKHADDCKLQEVLKKARGEP